MNQPSMNDRLSRVVKLIVDSGEAATVEDAARIAHSYQLAIAVGPNIARSPTRQAALLTAVNTGRRCFLGGVQVFGDLHVPLLVPWRTCRTLGEAVTDLQGICVEIAPPTIPHIVIGNAPSDGVQEIFAVRATFNGWVGGVVPLCDARQLPEENEFTPAGVLAGALGVAEAFQFVRGSHSLAGHREVGLSLWQPEQTTNWLEAEPGTRLTYLPSRLWLIGLGHLGQAYLWTLGFLPYVRPGDLHLVLQDFDALVEANDSTSLLTDLSMAGMKKARAMARWCEERGFRTVVNERRFAANFTVAEDEPQLALCGIDNGSDRRYLDRVGFKYIVDAGLGRGPQECLTMQLHTLPASRSAREIWSRQGVSATDALAVTGKPAYQALLGQGMDECGLVTLAQRTVGVPFVGAVAATLAIAEVIRFLVGGPNYEIIDGDLRTPHLLQALRQHLEPEHFNPGITPTYPGTDF